MIFGHLPLLSNCISGCFVKTSISCLIPMIPIKIQCPCGQRYVFDVDPSLSEIPHAVSCPSCGMDGNEAAKELLHQATAVPATATPKLRVSAVTVGNTIAAAAPRISAPIPQIDRAQAEHEARAKIFWGDDPDEVTRHLMMQGLSLQDASALVAEFNKERAAATRGNGFRKLFIGVPMMFVPVVAFVIFSSIRIFPLKIFAVTVMVGIWGAWWTLNGTMMLIAPKIEPGDVADQ